VDVDCGRSNWREAVRNGLAAVEATPQGGPPIKMRFAIGSRAALCTPNSEMRGACRASSCEAMGAIISAIISTGHQYVC
jgi:hypothetical protein